MTDKYTNTSSESAPTPKYYSIEPTHRSDPLLRIYLPGKQNHDLPNIAELLSLPRCPRSPYENITAKSIEAAKAKEEAKKEEFENAVQELEKQKKGMEEEKMKRMEDFRKEIAQLKAAHVLMAAKVPKGKM